MDSCYKLRQHFYYKVRHGLLQIATGITKCDDYCKLRQYSFHCPGDVAVYALGTSKTVWFSVYVCQLRSVAVVY